MSLSISFALSPSGSLAGEEPEKNQGNRVDLMGLNFLNKFTTLMHGEEHNCSPQFSRCNIRVPSTEMEKLAGVVPLIPLCTLFATSNCDAREYRLNTKHSNRVNKKLHMCLVAFIELAQQHKSRC